MAEEQPMMAWARNGTTEIIMYSSRLVFVRAEWYAELLKMPGAERTAEGVVFPFTTPDEVSQALEAARIVRGKAES